MDVFRCHIAQINVIDAGAVLHVKCHAGRRGDVVQRQRAVTGQCPGIAADPVHLADCLHHLKQPRTARYSVSLESGRDRKADRLVRAGGIRHHQMGGQGVQAPLHTLHRGVKGLEINGNICPVLHAVTSLQ